MANKFSPHRKVVKEVSKALKIPPEEIDSIVKDFFSLKGIRYFTCLKYTIDIPYFGRYYFKTPNKEARRALALKIIFKKKSRVRKSS